MTGVQGTRDVRDDACHEAPSAGMLTADTYRLETSVNLHVEDVRLDGTTR